MALPLFGLCQSVDTPVYLNVDAIPTNPREPLLIVLFCLLPKFVNLLLGRFTKHSYHGHIFINKYKSMFVPYEGTDADV